MTAAAKSVFYFGIYLYIVAITLVFVPNVLLKMLQIPETNEGWIRVIGVLVFCIAFYYHRAGAANISAFFPLTIPTRIVVLVCFIAFALLKWVSPTIIGIGAIDFAGAIWTWIALRKSR